MESISYKPLKNESCLFIQVQNDVLSVGRKFNSVDDVKAVINAYNSENSTEFVITTNNKKSLLIKCSHGIARKSKSIGKRPHQHYNFIGCCASITMYKSVIGSVKITQVNLAHSHAPNLSATSTLTPDEEHLVTNLRSANAQTSQIKRVLSEKYQKTFTTQKLRNLMSKLKPPGASDDTTLETFLLQIDDEGGKIEYDTCANGDIKTLFVASKTMIDSFSSSDPPLIQVDLSFDVDKARYKIAAFCYLNPTTNKTEIAAIAYTADETAESLDFIFQNFSVLCANPDKIFIVDKDFTQLDSIKRHFPGCTVLLCQFHTLKYMRTLLATALATVEKKTELFAQFKKILYAHSEVSYYEENATFIEASRSTDIQIRINQQYKSLHTYYSKNWESCKTMWVKCFRKNLPILGDNTTNRVERTFWSLKQSLRDTFGRLPDTASSIMHVIKLADSRLKERYNYTAVKSLRIFDSNKDIQSLNDAASQNLNDRGCTIFHIAQKLFEKYRSKLSPDPNGVAHEFDENSRKVYGTTSVSCDCSFHTTHQAPCLHILFFREQGNEGFSKNTFNNRYFKMDEGHSDITFPISREEENTTSDHDDLELDMDNDDNVVSLDEREKYKIVTPILLRIGSVISAHSSNQFLKYIDELNHIERRIRRGESILDLTIDANHDTSPPAVDVANNNLPCENIQSTPPNVPAVSADSDAISTVSQTATSSKFANLSFKTGVTTKGRPRKSKKQVSFRRTQVDKQPSKKKPRKTPKAKTRPTPDFDLLLQQTRYEDPSPESHFASTSPTYSQYEEEMLAQYSTPNVSNIAPIGEVTGMYVNQEGDGSQFSLFQHLNDESTL